MNRMSVFKQIAGLFGWLAVSFAVSALASVASVDAGGFYQQLDRPAWAPPGWLFGPVWGALYLLMGIAAWLVWRGRGFQGARAALTWFLLQLAANALWSWLFFAWKQGAAASGEILVLWALILATMLSFWRVNRLAGALLLPYLAWVSFAAALAFSLWQRNPQWLG